MTAIRHLVETTTAALGRNLDSVESRFSFLKGNSFSRNGLKGKALASFEIGTSRAKEAKI
jgi:hypothetical protein